MVPEFFAAPQRRDRRGNGSAVCFVIEVFFQGCRYFYIPGRLVWLAAAIMGELFAQRPIDRHGHRGRLGQAAPQPACRDRATSGWEARLAGSRRRFKEPPNA